MGQWLAVGNGFIEADVIRFREGVFARRGTRSKRPVHVGDRLVIGEVLRDDGDGWVYLLVIGCEIVSETTVKKLEPLKKGKEIKRKRKTIVRGEPERLRWSDESARALLTSQYLGNRRPVSSASKDTGES